ncbi:MAG: 2-hydroxychromene-2-carboxylate isomerase [Myxococcales bacterium]|nr:2-hydroxychromene-2-carboxylate isomerase [Myxococcales bacterium]
MVAVEFWFEFASTYSYPAAVRIGEVARAAGCAVVWRPFLLGPIFKQQGWEDSPFNLYPAKGRYMWRDLERVCAKADLPFVRPSVFPRNGLRAARVATAASDDWIEAFVGRVYRANFAEDRDISDPDVLTSCLEGLVPQPRRTLEEAGDHAVKQRLRGATEAAIGLGIFGAPTCVVHGELFWGNDRIEAAIEAARSR